MAGAVATIVAMAAAGFLGWLWWRADREAASLRVENESLRVKAAELEAGARGAVSVEQAREQLRDAVKAATSDAIRDASGRVIEDAKSVVEPLRQNLDRFESLVRQVEEKREGAYGGLLQQLGGLQDASLKLSKQTAGLEQALQSTGTAGKWGELSLRRIVEMAGLQPGVHFVEQAVQEDGRPDLVVNLPGGGALPIDAKVTLNEYLAATKAADDGARRERLDAHAQALRRRVLELGRKEYWRQFERAPEFVVMFVPIEASLAAAFERAPDLLEAAIDRRVLIATPVTLLALLKAVAFGWSEVKMTENVRRIEAECRELYDRLIPFMTHFAAVGDRMKSAMDEYNRTVGSARRQIIPSMRRLKELGAGTREIPEPETQEGEPDRLPASAEGGGS